MTVAYAMGRNEITVGTYYRILPALVIGGQNLENAEVMVLAILDENTVQVEVFGLGTVTVRPDQLFLGDQSNPQIT